MADPDLNDVKQRIIISKMPARLLDLPRIVNNLAVTPGCAGHLIFQILKTPMIGAVAHDSSPRRRVWRPREPGRALASFCHSERSLRSERSRRV